MAIITQIIGGLVVLLALGLLWLGATEREEQAGAFLFVGVLLLVLGLFVATGRFPLKSTMVLPLPSD